MLFKQTKHNKYHWQLFLWGQNWWFAADPEGDFLVNNYSQVNRILSGQSC